MTKQVKHQCPMCGKQFHVRHRPRASTMTSDPFLTRLCLYCAMCVVAGPPPRGEA